MLDLIGKKKSVYLPIILNIPTQTITFKESDLISLKLTRLSKRLNLFVVKYVLRTSLLRYLFVKTRLLGENRNVIKESLLFDKEQCEHNY